MGMKDTKRFMIFRRFLRAPLIAFAVVFPTIPAAAQAPGAQVAMPSVEYPYPAHGVLIGQGWDTFNDAGTSASCVDVDAVVLEKSSFTTEVKQVQSSLSILNSQSASLKAAYKGSGAKGSASASRSSSTKINTDSQNFLFTFESANGSTFAVAKDVVRSQLVNLSNPSRLMISNASPIVDPEFETVV